MTDTKTQTKTRAKKTAVRPHIRQATRSLRFLASVSELSLADQEAIAELLASAQRLSKRLRQSTAKSRRGKAAVTSRNKAAPKNPKAGATRQALKGK